VSAEVVTNQQKLASALRASASRVADQTDGGFALVFASSFQMSVPGAAPRLDRGHGVFFNLSFEFLAPGRCGYKRN